MFSYTKLVEKKIKEAEQNSEFNNLPGHGKLLDLEDDSRIPDELRLAYKILKYNGTQFATTCGEGDLLQKSHRKISPQISWSRRCFSLHL